MLNNFWNLRVNDRLAEWKNFRHRLSDLPIDQAIPELNSFWSSAPYVTFYLDPSDPNMALRLRSSLGCHIPSVAELWR